MEQLTTGMKPTNPFSFPGGSIEVEGWPKSSEIRLKKNLNENLTFARHTTTKFTKTEARIQFTLLKHRE